MFRLSVTLVTVLLLGIVSGCGSPTATPTMTPTLTSTEIPTAEPPPPTETPIPPPTDDANASAQVINIVDGDTIDVLINGAEYRVRYILVDTPERDMPYYSEATAANAALVNGQTVSLVKDVNETDRYGRLLRYVYLADGTFVNEELVRQGYAQIATFPPDVAMEATIRAAQAEAIETGRGLWANGSGDPNGGDSGGDDEVCDPAYPDPDVCIPPIAIAGDLDCGDIPQFARFTVLPPDPHGFDGRDDDGLGCENNPGS